MLRKNNSRLSPTCKNYTLYYIIFTFLYKKALKSLNVT